MLELPEVCKTGEGIKATMSADVQSRVNFVELDATSPDWPVSDAVYDIVLMSYISGSVPEGAREHVGTHARSACCHVGHT